MSAPLPPVRRVVCKELRGWGQVCRVWEFGALYCEVTRSTGPSNAR